MGKQILAGDIGGTKTHLALFEKSDSRNPTFDRKYKSAEYRDLITIVKEFLNEQGNPEVSIGCFGIAGPVQQRKSKTTNLPWEIDADLIEKETGITRVHLINDLEANAHGIDCLIDDELYVLNPGIEKKGNRALIAAGTGLGEAGIYFDGKVHRPFGSEGGHCSFAPENDLEIKLLRYLKKQYDHVSYERILSGPGFTHLYRFLIDEGIESENESVRKSIEEGDAPRIITEMGMKGSDPACQRAVEMFVAIYGSEAANVALQMLSIGGLYVGGGIAPKILNEMREGDFMKRFIQKGRFTSLLLGIPVKVILNEHTALLGAGAYARKNS